jgi:hypothetical protein
MLTITAFRTAAQPPLLPRSHDGTSLPAGFGQRRALEASLGLVSDRDTPLAAHHGIMWNDALESPKVENVVYSRSPSKY